MTPDELVADSVQNVVDVEAAVFLSQLSLENDVKKKVSEFLGKAFGIIVVDGFENLVGFLDKHGLEGVAILLLIPGTAVRTAQRSHDFNELFELCPGHSV